MDVKPYGKVYQHIVETAESNYGKHTLPWKYDKTKNGMLKTALDEYKADNSYPIQLHETLSDHVLRWCLEGYTQTDATDLREIFMNLWKFHKRWLIAAETYTASQIMTQMNKEAVDAIAKACSGINESFDKRKEKITDLYTAVMEHVIEMSVDEPTE